MADEGPFFFDPATECIFMKRKGLIKKPFL